MRSWAQGSPPLSQTPRRLDPPHTYLTHPKLSLFPPPHQKIDLATNKKPIMFIFTQPGCSACAALKAQLAPAPQATSALSRMFHVVHVDGDAMTHSAWGNKHPEHAPDGQHYVPRAVFADAKGKVRPDLKAPGGDAEFPYYYSSTSQMERGMRAAYISIMGGGKGVKAGKAATGVSDAKASRRARRAEKKKKEAAAKDEV